MALSLVFVLHVINYFSRTWAWLCFKFVARISSGRSQIHYLPLSVVRERKMVARDFRFSIPLFRWLQFEHMVRWAKPLGRMKEWALSSFGGVGLGSLEAGRYRRPTLGLRGWGVVSESVLAFVFYFQFVSGVGKFSTVGRAFYSRCE
jgi:hypothetical protein